jgi:hypothetical protein
MATFIVSQGERWTRRYRVQASDLEDAKRRYNNYLTTGDMRFVADSEEPEYIDDTDDVIWFDADGEEL